MQISQRPTVGILSLGCPRNLVDSEVILGRLRRKGYCLVDITKADVAIVNTCGFIKDAVQESIDAILELIELKKKRSLKKIIVCGCLVQRYRYDLVKELPEVDAFSGRITLVGQAERFSLTPRYYAYLKICEGCVHTCSFCIIPKIKGRFCSLSEQEIISTVRGFNNNGLSELNIVGQDTSGWGLDYYEKRRLPQLLKMILTEAPDIHWIRLLYLYPHPVVKQIAKMMRQERRLCRYIDLPIQHINDRLLKLMCRQTSKKDIKNLIDAIRRIIPDSALRTSLIVGFPSETDEEFEELLDFVREVRFERLGVFMYSQEEGTRASSLKGQVPYKIKEARLDAIMSEQQEISRKLNQRFLGKTIEVLVEGKDKDLYLGRSEYDAPEVDGLVYIKSQRALRPGEFVKVKIYDTLEYDLVAEVLS